MLNMIEHGAPNALQTVVIVHGLYGSGRNWGVVARKLAGDRHVVAVDQRNHGFSPWFDSHTYADMAADLAEVIENIGGPVEVIGHSMGGKAAMVLAMTRPELVSGLLIADIAPVAYTHDQTQFIEAMRAVDLSRVEKRSDALEQLAENVDDPTLRSFFTQSLDLHEKRWRLNLDILDKDMEKIVGFPDISGSYDGPTLFLAGALSEYILPEHRKKIQALFPRARHAKLPGAGHWLHAEKPKEFIANAQAWLSRPA